MLQGQLAADEAELLGEIRTRTGRVEDQLVLDGAAEQGVDRLLADLAEQVVQREIDSAQQLRTRPLRP